MRYYVACVEMTNLEQDSDEVGYCGHFLVQAVDKNEAHGKVHKFLYEVSDRTEGQWYISFEERTRQRITSITEIITLHDLEKVLPKID